MGLMEMVVCGKNNQQAEMNMNKKKIKGRVVLMKKNVVDLHDFSANILDRIYEIIGKRVSIHLITHSNGVGKGASLEKWVTKKTPAAAGESSFTATFDWEESMGFPGAFIIKNHHPTQFYLKSLTLQNVPGHGTVRFPCNSWVYPVHYYKYDRVFFSNKAYLPCDTPDPLRQYREQELINLRGNGSGMLQKWDRVYDYDYYNDLGMPDKGLEYARPVLGGSKEYPYPRRGRTGRPPTKTDPNTEKRLFLLSLKIYVPCDERFSRVKFSDFLAYSVKSIGQVLRPEIMNLFDKTPNEFDSYRDVLALYDDGVKLANRSISKVRKRIPLEMIEELKRSDGERHFMFPMPDVIKEDKSAWRTDEEFGREMLAGVNPVVIRQLQEFPPVSKLDPKVYGNQTSSMTREHLEKNMNGLSVQRAIENHKLYILDHHDTLMPYLRRINTTASKVYATRTVLLLQDDSTLRPLAIELSLPHPQGDIYGCTSHVFFTPATNTPADSLEATIWHLAKAYVAVNDSGYHQLISHWLNTHAVIEPFIIAMNRQLSVMHPIFKLLQPHFRDTMNINALARQILINAGGVVEMTVFPAKYAMEMSSIIYKNWDFSEQALPVDLLKRGVAIEDSTQPHGLKLLIDDYPFAVDGLEIWSAIETWVNDYCSIYYTADAMVNGDTELRSWWSELRTAGHGDKKDEPWWPEMTTIAELTHTCTIIIWVASALHAAVNFGQYPYAGYLPNRPTVSRRFMPEPGSPEFAELESDPEKGFLKTITSQLQTLLGISLIEILSRHSTDEIYLGQRESPYWTADAAAAAAFERFGERLVEIEERIKRRNTDEKLKNRFGPVKVPYTLLYPNTSDFTHAGGLTGKGIPNSVSI